MRISLSLHNHSLMSDGELDIRELLTLLGSSYDVIAITDHDTLTIPHPLQTRDVYGGRTVLLLKGIEYSAYHMTHLVGLEPLDPTGTPLDIWKSCRVKWISHPRLSNLGDEGIKYLLNLFPDINGMEMFNSGILQIDDNLLSFPGMNFYASDDLHMPYQLRASWMEMDVDSLDKEEILQKLIDGSFIVCTDNRVRNTMGM